MEMLDAQTKAKQVMQKEISGEIIFCEAQGDFILPDYLPEIRKIIRIDTKIIPSGKFIGASRATLAGIAAYNLIYTDSDGKLAATSLSSDYEFSVPLPSEHGELYVVADGTLENTQCRLGGPRKLSLRTGIKNRVHVYSSGAVSEIVDEGAGDVKALFAIVDTMVTKCASSGEFSVSETVDIDGFSADSLHANFTTADLVVKEAKMSHDAVGCRGEIYVKCNISSEAGEVFTVMKKIPFEQIVNVPTENMQHCIAYGRCSYVNCSLVPNGEACALNIELGAELDVECCGNISLSLMCDAYSTELESAPVYKNESFSYSLGATMGNYTVDASRHRSEDEENIIAILDTRARADIKSVMEKEGRAVVCGECRVEALTSSAGRIDGVEYGNSEIIIPFKIETELRVPRDEALSFDAHVEAVTPHARLEQDSISADAEIFLCVRASKKNTRRLLESVSFGGELKKDKRMGEVIVVYPEDEDTLFSIAKRYRVCYEELARENGIPEEYVKSPDEKYTLDGISNLLIP